MRPVVVVALGMGGLAAIAGLVLGWRVATTTEGDVIARAGDAWMALGGDKAQCVALPGDVAWVAVICRDAVRGRLYQFDRLGRMAVSPIVDAADAAGRGT